jgi:hypothetical protein
MALVVCEAVFLRVIPCRRLEMATGIFYYFRKIFERGGKI